MTTWVSPYPVYNVIKLTIRAGIGHEFHQVDLDHESELVCFKVGLSGHLEVCIPILHLCFQLWLKIIDMIGKGHR